MMSLKHRKFSLDSSMLSQDATSHSHRRGSHHFHLKKHRTSHEDVEQDIQELNQNSNGIKEMAEEGVDRTDGLIRHHSFSKHNQTFHKLFHEIPEEEKLTHTFVCSLQKEVPYHGKLYISENHVCFFSSVLLKETKVVMPTSIITEVKKLNSALSMLSIQTADGDKYFFMSLRNREMCYNLLKSVCSHAQGDSAKSSPLGSSAENEAESNMQVSGHSSIDDAVDQGQYGKSLGDNILQSASKPKTASSTRSMSTTEEADNASTRLWNMMEDAIMFFFSRRQTGNFSMVFFIYLILLVLLLLVSGYIGLRMLALEKQLTSLTELSFLDKEHQET